MCWWAVSSGVSDSLGYRLSPNGLTVAKRTWKRFVERATRLYEQERGKPEGFPPLGACLHRFSRRQHNRCPARQPGRVSVDGTLRPARR